MSISIDILLKLLSPVSLHTRLFTPQWASQAYSLKLIPNYNWQQYTGGRWGLADPIVQNQYLCSVFVPHFD